MNKKTILLTMTAILVAVSLISCEDDIFTDKSKDIDIQSLIVPENYGIMHNTSCEYVMDSMPTFDYTDSIDIQTLIDLVDIHFYNEYGVPINSDYDVSDIVWDILYGNDNLVDTIIDRVDDILASDIFLDLSFLDRDMILTAWTALLNVDTSLTNVQQYTEIDQFTDSLLTAWNNITWDSTTADGDVSGAFIAIMSYSNDLWHTYFQEIEMSPERKEYTIQAFWGFLGAVVYADAGGYLIGWAGAVIDEIDKNGKLDVKNSNKRIKKAAKTAGDFSSGKALGIG